MVKNVFTLVLAGLFLLTLSCNDLKDYSGDVNIPPVLKISKSVTDNFGFSINDSFKVTNSSQYDLFYSLSYIANLSIEHEFLTGNGTVTFDNATKQILFKPIGTGNVIFTLSVTDPFNNKSITTVNLLVFDNLPPVAKFSYSIQNSILFIDATGSYDQDKKWGGSIVQYEYNLNGVKSYANNGTYMQTIEPNKSYSVSLRVEDNNNTWSALYQQTFNNF